MEILKRNEQDRERERLAKLAQKANAKDDSISGLMVEEEDKTGEENHLASGFVRSKSNMMMRQRNQIDEAKAELERQKTEMV